MTTRTLLNTLFVQTQGSYLSLDHETIRVQVGGERKMQIPLHHIGGVIVFGNVMLSPFLIHRCAADGRDIVMCDANGRFQARVVGPTSGNVLLRRAQYETSDNDDLKLDLARSFVDGKIRGARHVVQRAYRDYRNDEFKKTADDIGKLIPRLQQSATVGEVRGIEGAAASQYFKVFPRLLRNTDVTFAGRTRRPPRDPVNAVLSFVYSILTRDCISSLECIGLDPQVGFLHEMRPGRPALALDLMEEFRHPFADRIVLSLFNRRQLKEGDFGERPGGAVLLEEEGRKKVLLAYQERKQDEVMHPLFERSVPIGLLPYIQARVLARKLRSDIEEYVSYRWR
ncbi:MAG: type I-C CRISPR-associated endonuclease Cas1 [Firmicutes bacterium]|nr:type I-C CRISPR-associated endonuclease Cas1 [Bacillota bacterium]